MGQVVLQFGDIELNPEQYELRRSGRMVKLERQPMELLILLAQRPAQLVTRDDIIARPWGPGSLTRSGTCARLSPPLGPCLCWPGYSNKGDQSYESANQQKTEDRSD